MDLNDKEIDVLLAEYQACYANRDHYDSLRWTIGSIFMGASLATFGISFLVSRFDEVLLTVLFSEFLFVAFISYDQLVQPYVEISLKRCQELEEKLRSCFKSTPMLHSVIHERTHERWPRGKTLTDLMIVGTTTLWDLRLAIFHFPLHGFPLFQGMLQKASAIAIVTAIGVLTLVYRLCYPHGTNVETPIALNSKSPN